jgi:hypothetical protein
MLLAIKNPPKGGLGRRAVTCVLWLELKLGEPFFCSLKSIGSAVYLSVSFATILIAYRGHIATRCLDLLDLEITKCQGVCHILRYCLKSEQASTFSGLIHDVLYLPGLAAEQGGKTNQNHQIVQVECLDLECDREFMQLARSEVGGDDVSALRSDALHLRIGEKCHAHDNHSVPFGQIKLFGT